MLAKVGPAVRQPSPHHNILDLQNALHEVAKKHILSVHVVTRCDIVSSSNGIGKQKALTVLQDGRTSLDVSNNLRFAAAAICDLNPSSPRQNGRHFADDIFRCIFVNEKFFIDCNLIAVCLIDNNPALV